MSLRKTRRACRKKKSSSAQGLRLKGAFTRTVHFAFGYEVQFAVAFVFEVEFAFAFAFTWCVGVSR